MHPKLDFLMIGFLYITPGNLLTAIGSILIIVYYLSMLKMNVVDKYYKRSWKFYLKSIFKKENYNSK